MVFDQHQRIFSFSSGIFKNNQAQIDEYLTALNPLLRRTTEGKQNVHYNSKPVARLKTISICE
jgi:hypothetical protein